MSLFPESFKKMPPSHKIAYIAVMSALAVIANIFDINLGGGAAKLSFVSTVLIMAGAIFGPLIGFVIGFMGDAIEFLIAPSGIYSPFIGISNGTIALIAGFVFIIFAKQNLIIKVLISSVLTYIICTIAISSTGLYIIYFHKKFDSLREFVIYRISTQTPINVINAFICYFFLKAMTKIKILRFSFS